MRNLIWHSLNKRWLQSLATLITVTGSVAVLFALFLVYLGVTGGMETSRQRMGADLLVIPAEAQSLLDDTDLLFTGAPATIYMDKNYVEKIKRIDGVTRVTAQFFGQTLNASCCSSIGAVRLIGFDPGGDWVIRPWADQLIGRALADNEIIIGSNVGGFDTPAPKILGHAVKVAATLAPTGTSMDQSILMNIDAVRTLSRSTAGYGHFWTKYGDPSNLVSAILIQVQKGKIDNVTNALSQWGDLKVIKSNDVLQTIQGQMHTVFMIMLGGGILLVLISFLQLFARFFTMVWDRKSELGLYRALGATKGDLRKLIVGEAAALSAGGVLVGLILGSGLYLIILRLLQDQNSFPFIKPHGLTPLIGAGGLAVLFGLLAAVAVCIPLRQLNKIDPSLAMQREDID